MSLNSSSTFAIQLKFSHALSIIRTIPPDLTELQPVVADKLQFYGLYKQATQGDINIHKPSSKLIVESAKWKAWYRMKGMSPLEAQKLYVDSLIQLLTELVHRYPRHEYTEFLTSALANLQSIEGEQEDVFEDAYDPSEFENNEHFLNYIDPQHIVSTDSPPFSYYRRQSDPDYPPTPITSPGKHDSYGVYVKESVSESDTVDREVAATTSGSHRREETLERLQTEITALTEQMDRLRTRQSQGWNIKRVLWTLVKHVFADSFLLLILFLILWKRKSPLAYAVIDRVLPLLRSLIYKMLRYVVFWKVTV